MEPRVSQLAKNEALFRQVNERLVELTKVLSSRAGFPSEPLDGLVCECADPLCLVRVGQVSMADYEAVRGNPTLFIVAPGHVTPEAHTVQEQRAYWFVAKNEGMAAEVVRELDPRS
jgi:hypothetical protein